MVQKQIGLTTECVNTDWSQQDRIIKIPRKSEEKAEIVNIHQSLECLECLSLFEEQLKQLPLTLISNQWLLSLAILTIFWAIFAIFSKKNLQSIWEPTEAPVSQLTKAPGSQSSPLGAAQGPWKLTKAPGSRLRPLGAKMIKTPGIRPRPLGVNQGSWESNNQGSWKLCMPLFCREMLNYDMFARFGQTIWITHWEPKSFVSLRWEPKLHFIRAWFPLGHWFPLGQ